MVNFCAAYNCREKYVKGGLSFHSFPKDPAVCKLWVYAMRRLNFTPTKYSKLCAKHFTEDSFNTSPWSTLKALRPDAVPSIFDFPDNIGNNKKPRKPPEFRENPVSSVPSSVPSISSALKDTNVSTSTLEEPGAQNTVPSSDCEVVAECSADKVSSNNADAQKTVPSSDCEVVAECSADKVSSNNAVKKKRKSYLGDFTPEDMSSPTKAKRFVKRVQCIVKRKCVQIKTLQVEKKQLRNRLKELKSLATQLKSRLLTLRVQQRFNWQAMISTSAEETDEDTKK